MKLLGLTHEGQTIYVNVDDIICIHPVPGEEASASFLFTKNHGPMKISQTVSAIKANLMLFTGMESQGP